MVCYQRKENHQKKKDMSGCSNAKCAITGTPLGRIHKSDHRWSTGEICGIRKNINLLTIIL